jgi:hypothetical protein
MAQQKRHAPDFGPKQLKLKRGGIRVITRGRFTALVWKDRQEVYMLPNIEPPPVEGNFYENRNRPLKPHIVEQYNWHMGYVDNSENVIEKLESMESSVIGDSSKDSTEGSSQGELRCLESLQGATGKKSMLATGG